MIKFILIAGAALGASVVSASAGTEFSRGGSSGSEFNAENAWRHEISSGNYDYVAPASFDTLESLKNSSSSSAPTTGTTTGTTYGDGYDFLLGGNPDGDSTAAMTIKVNGYYYVNYLAASDNSSREDYTFAFGTSGAVYTYYECKFEKDFHSLKMSVDSSAVSTTENSSRVLFGSYGSNWTALNISENNLKVLSLDLGDDAFWTVSNTVYTDSTIEDFRDSSLNSPTAALFYSAADKTLSVVYAIPEPSAFGLLAGAGALALVAARRRRSRK